MLIKYVTLKFREGNRTTIKVIAEDEFDFAKKINVIMAESGAVGFGTQSTTVVK